jgi:hypothetical protein
VTRRLLLTTPERGASLIPPPSISLPEPWNATTAITVTTYDGSGATIHPSVVDMGEAGWNGYRYWLADTPYAGGNNQLENPSIWAGNDRETFVVPPGVTNPLVPAPGALVGFHSDVELVYDPDAGRMVLFYRLAVGSPSITDIYIRALTSTNGTTWTDQGEVAVVPTTGGRLSPAVVRTGVNEWRMWIWGGASGSVTQRTAPSPLGPWAAPVDTTLDGGSLDGWHGDVIQFGGRFFMAYSNNDLTEMHVATSTDGLAWVTPEDPVLITRTVIADGLWDRSIYRPTLSYGPEVGVMSVWYSAVSAPSPGGYAFGFTRIPIREWI